MVRLAFLSPSVIEAALAGRLLGHVHAETLKMGKFSPDWKEQERAMLPATAEASFARPA